ncbi:MAG: VCBS repeat-containing protein, partial [Ignavibacteria bacterium]|nr:VCBS repeat-containing protein [Ignavibacteria bacterium]
MKYFSVLLVIVVCLTINVFSQVQFTSHLVTMNAGNVEEMYAEDIDADGDLDILAALFVTNEIYWYKNDGSGNFTEFLISTEADGPRSVYAYDINSDSTMDVLSVS